MELKTLSTPDEWECVTHHHIAAADSAVRVQVRLCIAAAATGRPRTQAGALRGSGPVAFPARCNSPETHFGGLVSRTHWGVGRLLH